MVVILQKMERVERKRANLSVSTLSQRYLSNANERVVADGAELQLHIGLHLRLTGDLGGRSH